MEQKESELASCISSVNSPDYRRIYIDILHMKFPEKIQECEGVLKKTVLTELDILTLNEKIFGNVVISRRQVHRSYSEKAILQILHYQEQNMLNNKQLANKFGLSRNTITKWKKLFKASRIQS